MKKAVIIHQSKKGTTSSFGNEIGRFLAVKGIETEVMSIEEYTRRENGSFDYLFLGCWTKGLMVLAQHPDKQWKQFAMTLQIPEETQVILFTTYKIATGSMFRKMRKCLNGYSKHKILEIKSKDGNLSDSNAYLLDNQLFYDN
jgi:flavodoxin